MREIKFRGKRLKEQDSMYLYDSDNPVWAYGNLIIDKDGRTSILNDHGGFRTADEVDPETVGEYTGLKDRNGKEIYEGDIVKGKRVRRGDITRHIGKVEYRGAHFIVDGVKQYEHITDDLDSGYEVIGNIYENPELLEERTVDANVR